MFNVDMVRFVGSDGASATTVEDLFSTEPKIPDVDAQQDYLNTTNKEANKIHTITTFRKLTTTDTANDF